MRASIILLLGILVGIGISALWRTIADAPQLETRTPAAATPAADREADLRARIAALEAELRGRPEPAAVSEAHAAPTPAVEPGTLPEAEAVAELAEGGNLEALATELEKLLLSGEDGFAVLLDFLRGQAGPPKFALWRDGKLSFALASLALRHPDETAALLSNLVENLDPAKDAMIRDQVWRFLPAFLAWTGDRYADLRQAAEQHLLADLGQAGGNAWSTVQALDGMGVEVPLETFEGMLTDPAKKGQAFLALQQLAKRGDDASLDAIFRFVEGSADTKDWAVRQAISTLAQVQSPRAQERLEAYLASPMREIREAATLAWFSRQRGLESLPLLTGFLDSEADLQQKSQLVWQIRGTSPELFTSLEGSADALSSEDVRKAVRSVAEAGRGRGGNMVIQAVPAGAGQVQVIQVETAK